MRISDWSSDVCSSDLRDLVAVVDRALGLIVLIARGLVDRPDEQRVLRGVGCADAGELHVGPLDSGERLAQGGLRLCRRRGAGFALVRLELLGEGFLRLTVLVFSFSEIGRASCGEGVCQYVSISGFAG